MNRQIVDKVVKDKLLCEFYSIQDDGSFDVGCVIRMYENDMLISRITKDGEENGFQAIRYNDILFITIKSRYLGKMEKLANNDITSRNTIPEMVNSAIDAVLWYAYKEGSNIEVAFDQPFDNLVYGKCMYVDDRMVVVKELNSKGEADGETFFEISSIRTCCCEV